MRWLVSVLGGLLVCFAFYWSINPPLAEARPLIAGVLFVLGIGLVITGIIWHRVSKQSKTVTIALGDEAEKEAAVLETLQSAVRHHLNPDEVLPEQEHRKKTDEKQFIQLPKEEQRLRKIKKR